MPLDGYPELHIMQGGRGAGKTHRAHEIALEKVKLGLTVRIVQSLAEAAEILDDPWNVPEVDVVIVDYDKPKRVIGNVIVHQRGSFDWDGSAPMPGPQPWVEYPPVEERTYGA